jgi:hypothetical protein
MGNARDKFFGFLAELFIGTMMIAGMGRVFDIWLVVDWTPATKATVSGLVGGPVAYLLLKYIKRKGGWI